MFQQCKDTCLLIVSYIASSSFCDLFEFTIRWNFFRQFVCHGILFFFASIVKLSYFTNKDVSLEICQNAWSNQLSVSGAQFRSEFKLDLLCNKLNILSPVRNALSRGSFNNCLIFFCAHSSVNNRDFGGLRKSVWVFLRNALSRTAHPKPFPDYFGLIIILQFCIDMEPWSIDNATKGKKLSFLSFRQTKLRLPWLQTMTIERVCTYSADIFETDYSLYFLSHGPSS